MRVYRIMCGKVNYFWTVDQMRKHGIPHSIVESKSFTDDLGRDYLFVGEYVLRKGSELTNEEVKELPFSGKNDVEWVNCNSFYYDLNNVLVAGLYPVTTSCRFLPY